MFRITHRFRFALVYVVLYLIVGTKYCLASDTPAGSGINQQIGTEILYVDAGAMDENNGTSWADAYNSLQDAMTTASGGGVSEIWVAQGTYMPDGGYRPVGGTHVLASENREATFQLLNSVAIYGGFAGSENDLSQRDITSNPTILSGDLTDNDGPNFANNGENSYHVVTGNSTDTTALIDGFTITAGNASVFPNNRGAGMYNDNGSPTVTECRFTGNWAVFGSGMYNFSSNPTITDCMFSGNSATSGGGMYNFTSNSNLEVTNCTFYDNVAIRGGGMENNGSSPTVTDCTFRENSASRGAGMYNVGSSPTTTDCTFDTNTAGSFGGGMYNDRSSPTLNNCTFNANSVPGPTGGGGMYNESSSPILTDCTFSANSARLGGGMYSRDDSISTLTNCTFTGNTARAVGGGMLNNLSSSMLTDCTFSGNSAESSGGGMSISSGSIVTNCTFSDNSAAGSGGGMSLSGNSTVTNCTFRDNFAIMGGGMFIHFGSSSVINCTFSGNRASPDGGGIYNNFNNSTVTNCTFSRNSANRDGGGMFNIGNPTVTNCVLWGNTDSSGVGETAQIHNESGTPIVNHSIVEGGWSGAGGVGVLDTDPLFVDTVGPDGVPGTDDDNLRLSPGSHAINAGDNMAVPLDVQTDLQGHPRILCDTVDIGAYEFGIGDFNCDQVVDLTTDYVAWADCKTGPGEPGPPVYTPGCKAFESFFDGWIDLRDFATFQNVFSSTITPE